MQRDKRYTPPEMFQDLKEQTGVNWKRAMDPTPINPKRDGIRPWRAKYVYLNPPFSQLKKWVTHAMSEWRLGRITGGLAIVIPWYAAKKRKGITQPQPYVRKLRPNKIVVGNYKFIKPNGIQYKTPFEVHTYIFLR